MSFHDLRIFGPVVAITLSFAVLSLLGYPAVARGQYLLLAVGTVVVGIPHGATDDRVFRAYASRWRPVMFFSVYVVVAALYGALWIVLPRVSLAFFLFISMYHFGQSNLFHLRLPERSVFKKGLYLSWGAFVLLSPILLRFGVARPIIETIIGPIPVGNARIEELAPLVTGLLVIVNAAALAFACVRRALSLRALIREWVALAALLALFATAPLFVSFIVYWAFWHSLNAVLEISSLWSGRPLRYRVAAFFRAAAPLTLVTIAGMAFIFALAGAYGTRDTFFAVFFAVIAAVTLPHMGVMELLYRRKTPSA